MSALNCTNVLSYYINPPIYLVTAPTRGASDQPPHRATTINSHLGIGAAASGGQVHRFQKTSPAGLSE